MSGGTAPRCFNSPSSSVWSLSKASISPSANALRCSSSSSFKRRWTFSQSDSDMPSLRCKRPGGTPGFSARMAHHEVTQGGPPLSNRRYVLPFWCSKKITITQHLFLLLATGWTLTGPLHPPR